jgi:hypothetical protein
LTTAVRKAYLAIGGAVKMMHRVLSAAAACLLLIVPARVMGQERDAAALLQAFEHYEGIRVLLAEDSTAGIDTHARALAPAVSSSGDTRAVEAVERLASGRQTLAAAREEFSMVSSVLVPRFLSAQLPGVHAFMCPMKKASWAQRTNRMANPYYGRAMSNCGSEIKAGQ